MFRGPILASSWRRRFPLYASSVRSLTLTRGDGTTSLLLYLSRLQTDTKSSTPFWPLPRLEFLDIQTCESDSVENTITFLERYSPADSGLTDRPELLKKITLPAQPELWKRVEDLASRLGIEVVVP